MKKLYVILGIILFSQLGHAQTNESFESLWKKVQKLEERALTKSALALVETLSTKAEAEKNDAQRIKALLYKSKFVLILEEDAQLRIINDFKAEIEKAESPAKNLLHSYLADLYWQYFQQNRYRFYDRTATGTKVDTVDFRTWDLTTIFQEIDLHFEASLANQKVLQQLPVSQFEVVLNEQENSKVYRPTLFDILAHNALDFYTTGESTIAKPAEHFEIDSPELLCEAYSYSFIALERNGPLSIKEKALAIYSELVAFHFGDLEMDALVIVDIERLGFIHEHAVFTGKDAHYIEVLQNAAEGIKNSPLSGLYTYEIAQLYQQLGNTYDPRSNTQHQWKLKEAIALCDSVIASFPESLGADKCKALKSQIKQPSLRLTGEKHVPTNTSGRLLVDYKNYTDIVLTAHRFEPHQLTELEGLYPEQKQLDFIRGLPIAKTWSAALKTENDYQNHGTEIAMPPLENGYYIILVRPVGETDTVFSFATVQATNLALIETNTETHQFFQVIDRTNGKPIHGAAMTLEYRTNYDGPLNHKSLVTDTQGGASINKNKNTWSNLQIGIKKERDSAYFGAYYIGRSYSQSTEDINYASFLFTDRSIYRPGQPLYFKGIVLKQEHGTSRVLEGTKVAVTLEDVNGQALGTQSFSTNAYGSFSGEFMLPNNGLTGAFTLHVLSEDVDLDGYTHFSVEAYKRPKFETVFEPISQTYKVNDSIKLEGKAIAYAGSTISDAKVIYRVKRIVNLPRWHYWSRPYFNGTPQEIAHGETTTDASGKYELIFEAHPDTSIDKKDLPIFNYEVTADVTDSNGETRSTTTVVSVGYHALDIELDIPKTLDKHSKKTTFRINSTNLNGESVPATGQVTVYKLDAPHHVLRPRSWPAPDYPGFTKENFKRLFPHEAYKNEDDPVHWEKGKMVWKSDFDTGTSKELELGDLKKWASGQYKMVLESTDRFGQAVNEIVLLELTDSGDKKPADHRLFQVKTDKTVYAVGEEAKITFLSGAQNLSVSVTVEKNHTVVDSVSVTLDNNSKTIKVPITAADLGGFTVHYSYAFQNHFESGSLAIHVPYPESDLQIEALTFRDKIAPGTDQTWSFKIKGPKGDRVSAELLASMYDASLDQFKGHSWGFDPLSRPGYYSRLQTNAHNSFSINGFNTYHDSNTIPYAPLVFDALNWFGLYFGSTDPVRGYYSGLRVKNIGAPSANLNMEEPEAKEMDRMAGNQVDNNPMPSGSTNGTRPKDKNPAREFDTILIRQNLQETAFFFPHLLTDKEGNVSFGFTTPEALTRWKLQVLAHTKTLESSIENLTTVTQKELMVLPNAPRFLREGDVIVISSKVANLTEKALRGWAKLEVLDGLTGKDISKAILSPTGEDPLGERSFEVDSLGNTQVSWQLRIPKGLQAVQYKILAKAGNFSDGEQHMLPVLTNRTLVSETLPMWVGNNQAKTFTLEKLRDNTSTTRTDHQLTLEITSNPAWYAVQALPYLMEYPYQCNEQTFAKYYANTLAGHIANSNPRIKEVFEQWADSDALIGNLEKNEELKSLLIQETPWIREARSETEKKKRIGLLFNMNTMKNQQELALTKLRQNQKSNGAWPWFNGGPDNRYVTQHIVSGLGHLKHLKVASASLGKHYELIENALAYLEAEFVKEYEAMKKRSTNLNDDHLSESQVQFLYMRSFFSEINTSKKVGEITAYYKKQAQKYWKEKGLLSQGMLALVLHRMEDAKTANSILRSLQENSIISDELGMYWKQNTNSWNWYQAPIETQALMIEAFSEIHPTDTKTIDNLKIWLLKNKQTNQWPTTKATTEAIYSLLLQGKDWLSVTDAVEVLVGGEKIKPDPLENNTLEVGTGYFKTSWDGAAIRPKMAEVSLRKKGEGMAWGALYWQYFEDLDKITGADTPLGLRKKLFLKKNTDTGEILVELTDKTILAVGDLVRVRIELKADRPMEFIHMKDMRAAGFEPANVLSQYKWQDGLGYYESTRDASTNFFFDYLPKGVHVFEYDLRVNNAGEFSNGITTVQSMYAPEFTSHSEGARVKVNSK